MSRIGYLQAMIVQVNLPDELVAKIDKVAQDRTAFVSEAVRWLLHDGSENPTGNETARINELADELNRFLDGEPVRARPVGPASKVWRWCRRKPALSVTRPCTLCPRTRRTGTFMPSGRTGGSRTFSTTTLPFLCRQMEGFPGRPRFA